MTFPRPGVSVWSPRAWMTDEEMALCTTLKSLELDDPAVLRAMPASEVVTIVLFSDALAKLIRQRRTAARPSPPP